MAFVWSCFEPRCRSRQFCYLYGPHGEEGKSTVLTVLYRLFGVAAVSLNNSLTNGEMSARWLPAMLLGKRVVVWPDCKNPRFAMSEILRNIVSGDPVPIERKGEDPFTAILRVRLFIASNTAPEITDEGANSSRLLRVDVDKRLSDEAGWEDKLEQEMPYFLYACRAAYQELCPDHGAIRLGTKAKKLITESATADSQWDEILQHVRIGETESCEAGTFQALCRQYRLSNTEIGYFKAYLLKKYGVKKDHHQKRYHGVSILPNTEMFAKRGGNGSWID
jgi:hypothetical protein